jgi:hypothetical protein
MKSYARLILAVLMAGIASGLLVKGVRTSSVAQSSQERQVDNDVPKHVPIKVKLKAEKAAKFKDLSNSDWLRDFELEVTNTSDKPIYFLELWVELPDMVSENNNPLAFSLRYGRIDFIHFNTRPIETDVPIQPGETHNFTIDEKWIRGWEQGKARTKRSDPKRVRFVFVDLSFGDGTGFTGGGEAYPYKKEQSSTASCRGGPKQAEVEAIRKNGRISFPALREHSLLRTPAAILPASFFLLQTSYRQPEPLNAPDINCPGTDCIFAKGATYNCAVVARPARIRLLAPEILRANVT